MSNCADVLWILYSRDVAWQTGALGTTTVFHQTDTCAVTQHKCEKMPGGWNEFETDPVISLLVPNMCARATNALRSGRCCVLRTERPGPALNQRVSFTGCSVISKAASRSTDDLCFYLQHRAITYSFSYHHSDSFKRAKIWFTHRTMGFERDIRAVEYYGGCWVTVSLKELKHNAGEQQQFNLIRL